jgi:hypothetical protein
MAKTILEEAMADAKLLKETAIENAKNVLVEALSPKIKKLVESQLGDTGMNPMLGQPDAFPQEGMYEEEEKDEEDVLSQLSDEESEDESEEGVEEKNKDTSEDEEMAEQLHLEEKDEEKEEEKEEEIPVEEVDEVVEITNEDLKAALAEALGSMKEVTVTKGFGDVADTNKGEMGIAEKESGEKHFNEKEPPAKQDWTVKEAAMKKHISQLVKENQEYKQAVAFLKRNLQEVNLFNSKLLYTNKLLQSAEFNSKQRVAVIEAFDKAQSLREVELVYSSLTESLKISGLLSENKSQMKPTLKGPKSSRMISSSSTVLKEAMNREEKDDFSDRLQRLAGLID